MTFSIGRIESISGEKEFALGFIVNPDHGIALMLGLWMAVVVWSEGREEPVPFDEAVRRTSGVNESMMSKPTVDCASGRARSRQP